MNGRTAVVRARPSSPLKLLTPLACDRAAWIYTSTYGGGLVGGDRIQLDLIAGPATRCVLSTQSSTKVYRTLGPECRQELHVLAGDEAIVVVAPDPLVCFAGAKYAQIQRYDLARHAGLTAIDWMTSGRRAAGERWAFDRYESRTQVKIEGKLVFRESIRLNSEPVRLDSMMRMGMVNCFATLVIAGRPLDDHAQAMLDRVRSLPALAKDGLIVAASPIEHGVVVRIGGVETEAVGGWVRANLSFIGGLVGTDPWARKW